jgi:2-dehydropantoate 2-reductase
MREVMAVARARGVRVADEAVDRAIALVDALPAETTSSMAEDLRAGRRLEVEWLSGAVARFGAADGVPTPIHRVAHACLSPHAGGATSDHSEAEPR